MQRVASSLFSHDTNLLAGRGARIPAITSATDEDVQNVEFMASEVDSGPDQVSSVGFADLATPMATSPVSGTAVPDVEAAAPEVEAVSEPASLGPEPVAPALETTEDSPNPVDEPELQTGSISRHSIMEAARGSGVSPLASAEDEEPVESLFTTHHGSVAETDVPSFADIISGTDTGEFQTAHHSHRAPASEQTLTAEAQAQAGNEPAQSEQPAESASLTNAGDAAAWETAQSPEKAATSEESGVAQSDRTDLLNRDAAGLSVIAQVTGEDTPLIALVNFDGSAAEVNATLAERGVIVLEGREFDDPSEAARELGQDVDGWEFWHLGFIDGPTLAEAQAEINAEIERNR